MKNCLHCLGLWACLWGIALIKLIDVGGLIMGGTIPWAGEVVDPGLCKRIKQTRMHALVLLMGVR